MTWHPGHEPNGIAAPTRGEVALEQACAHLDAAATQLSATARDDPFTATRSLAGQLSLLRGGLHPGIRAVLDPTDRLGPLGHLDAALGLLDAIPRGEGPVDLIVWTLRLADLRPAVRTAEKPSAGGSTGVSRPEQP